MAFLAIAFFIAQGFGDPSRDFLLTETEAILLGPTEAVSGSMAESFKWSPDSKYIAVHRGIISPTALTKILANPGKDPGADVSPTAELSIWQASSKTSKRVFTIPAREASITTYGWIAGTTTLYASLSKRNGGSELWVAPVNGQPRKVAEATDEGFLEAIPSPTAPLIAIIRADRFTQTVAAGGQAPAVAQTNTLTFLDGAGRMSQEVRIPRLVAFFQWGPDGSTLYARSFYKNVDTPETPGAGFYIVHRDGRLQKTEQPRHAEIEPELLASFIRADVSAKGGLGGVKAPTAVLYPSKQDPKEPSVAVITTDGDSPAVSPDMSTVAFKAQGVVMVRPLMRVPKDAFLRARDAALRTELMNKAKQAGLALIMFAADNDENLPGHEGWEDKVMPYVKNRDLLNGFNYTYQGGPLDKVENPASTVIGYITGPGGRAIAYADGHVKWEGNGG